MARGGCKGLLEPKTVRLSHRLEQRGGGVEGEPGGTNAQYSPQGGLKLPLKGLALRRAFQAALEVLVTPELAENMLQGVGRSGLSCPSD